MHPLRKLRESGKPTSACAAEQAAKIGEIGVGTVFLHPVVTLRGG
jgi:hypothetical protein